MSDPVEILSTEAIGCPMVVAWNTANPVEKRIKRMQTVSEHYIRKIIRGYGSRKFKAVVHNNADPTALSN